MTVTFTFNNMLLAIAVAAIVIGVVYLVATLKKLSALITALMPVVLELRETVRRSNELLARAENVILESEETIRETKMAVSRIRGAIDSTSTLVEDAVSIFRPVSMIANAFRGGYSLIERLFSRGEDNAENEEE
ncbi:MAG TPA: hypothetical protein PK747_03805 [Acidobacteriota bacterium]|mgnify:CR=1|nr:hypothetical protein [Acidobacteriota bacterium]HNT17031.1 hypothetical protein [Acidobacteriota bacterium]HPA26397.1 hypothetical protein [Acidobacteriota bacterium]HQO19303.1 hypothetical protein [Acidobacteriota bacterium]HQQ46516.1 hypothetical protein [Acidobacteriota bacterium]